MSVVSVIEASKLTGKSVPTIYRHIKNGKLSRNGVDGIDTSELLRVYGQFKSDNQQSGSDDYQHIGGDNRELSFLKREIEILKDEVEMLKKDKSDSREREERLFRIIEARLPAPQPAAETMADGLIGKLKQLLL